MEKKCSATKQMDPSKKNDESKFVQYGILFITLIFILFYSISSTDHGGNILFSKRWAYLHLHHSQVKSGDTHFLRDELEEALQRASNKNNTLIIAMINDAYVEGDKPMLDLFLDAFWVGENTIHLVTNLLILAADNISYERCMFLRLHCYKLQKIGVQSAGDEKIYMSKDFIQMMWGRTQFLGDVLKRGYNFVFTDTDVMWLRNPFEILNQNQTKDFQISTDTFNGNDLSETNHINTGFYMVRSNNKTIRLFDEWYGEKNNSIGLKEQDVLQMLIHKGILGKLGIQVKFLDTVYFSGFCNDSKDIWSVKTVHANCCRSIKAKLADLLNVIHDWKRYKKNYSWNHQKKRLRFKWSQHIACQNSWNS